MPLAPWLERQLLHATAAFVEIADDLPAPAACGTGKRLREMVAHLPADLRRLLHMGGRLLDALSLLRHGRRFHRLPLFEARRLLRRLAASPLRPLRRLGFTLKMMCQFAYFASEETWEAVGYDGPWVGRRKVEVLPAARLERGVEAP